jgi:ABC-2 type transport system ATP-binding protein
MSEPAVPAPVPIEAAPVAPAPLSPASSGHHPRARGNAVVLDRLTKHFPVRRGWLEMICHPMRRELTPALREVSCEIAEGEFFGLLGPNGAGKTTLFKILATLVIPDGGTAVVAGHDVVREPGAVRRVLAPVIADERSLYWRLSAMANLELYGVLQGLRRPAARARAAELLHVVGLADAGEKMVGSFSSGMKQRLLIARALIASPSVLLLDEPTRSLDPVSARAFRTFLREEIGRSRGCTVLLATHNAEEALELCDRVGVLDRGRLLAAGPAEQLARELGEERYRMWTHAPVHPAVFALAGQGVIRSVTSLPVEEPGWVKVEMEVPGGLERAAQVTAFLIEQGVVVARFERVGLPLADLIERIVQRRAGATPGGEVDDA